MDVKASKSIAKVVKDQKFDGNVLVSQVDSIFKELLIQVKEYLIIKFILNYDILLVFVRMMQVLVKACLFFQLAANWSQWEKFQKLLKIL